MKLFLVYLSEFDQFFTVIDQLRLDVGNILADCSKIGLTDFLVYQDEKFRQNIWEKFLDLGAHSFLKNENFPCYRPKVYPNPSHIPYNSLLVSII